VWSVGWVAFEPEVAVVSVAASGSDTVGSTVAGFEPLACYLQLVVVAVVAAAVVVADSNSDTGLPGLDLPVSVRLVGTG